jgi:3-oxoacyl-[acyl-carrier protein] reductase
LKSERTIIIAGSRLGIGRALAENYAERGHDVIGLSRGQTDFVHEHYRHFTCDVGDEARVHRTFAEITTSGLAPDVVVYAAGIKVGNYAMLTGCSPAETMLRTNLLGAFLVTRHAVRLMKRRGFGRFVYLSSIAVPLAWAGTVMYGASKAGLEQMAFALSREFPKDNITFNCLGISFFPSAMLAAEDGKSLDVARASIVKPDNLKTEEITAAVDFFASDAARQVTGQTLYFGGIR